MDLPTGKTVVAEVFDDTEEDYPVSDLELATIFADTEIRAITDAPKLRAKDSQYCANCNFYKWLPSMRCYDEVGTSRMLTAEDVESIVAAQQARRGVCEEPSIEAEVGANWVCDKWEEYSWKDHMPEEEMDEEKALQLKTITLDTEHTVKKLAPIKMIGETHFAGYAAYFAKNPKEKDLTGTRFVKSVTDFGDVYDKVRILYHHGLTKAFDNDKIAQPVKAQVDDVGIWLEGELDRSKKYWEKIRDNIKKGIYYYSGGTAEHLIRYGEDGVIKSFPIIEWSLTTTPAEWRLGASQFYKSIGIDLDSGTESPADDKGKGDEKSRQSQKRESEKRDARNESSIKSSEVINMELTPEQLAEQVQSAVKAAMDAEKAIQTKAAQEVEAKRKEEEAHQATLKAATEKAAIDAVAAYKASLPPLTEQRPGGYGQYNIAKRPLGDGFSWVKAVRGVILSARGDVPNPWSGAERERDAMVKYANEVRATLAEGVGNLGGYLVPPEYMQDQFIPLLRARSVVRAANPRILQTKSDIVYIPSQTGGATAYWTGENSTITASNLTVGQLAINIRKLAALEYISNELLADASPSADQLIREDLATVIALKEDSTFLLSNGAAPSWANAPIGYVNYAGVTQVTLTNDAGNGATPVVGDIFAFKRNMMQNNIPADGWAWFMSPRTWDEVAQFKDTQNRYLLSTLTGGNISTYGEYGTYPEGGETTYRGSVQGMLMGYPVYVTANLTETNTKGNNTDCTFLILSRMADTMIVERAGLELMATNVAGTAFASDQTWIRGIMREGFGVRHAPGVTYADGVR